jgi:hypothetical protein
LIDVIERAGGREAARPRRRDRSPRHERHPESGRALRLRDALLFHEGRALSFPCDARGEVPLDALSERARNNYLYARTVIGREFFRPEVCRCEVH